MYKRQIFLLQRNSELRKETDVKRILKAFFIVTLKREKGVGIVTKMLPGRKGRKCIKLKVTKIFGI